MSDDLEDAAGVIADRLMEGKGNDITVAAPRVLDGGESARIVLIIDGDPYRLYMEAI